MQAHSPSSCSASLFDAYTHLTEGLDRSPQWTAHSTMPSSSAMDTASCHTPRLRDSALTSSPNSRTTGLPSTVSFSTSTSSRSPNVAISSVKTTSYSNSAQNAGSVLNPSSSSSTLVTRSNAQSSTEPLVPTYSSNYVLNNTSTRPRTSNQVFASTTDLAAHYGIPTSLPPLPSIQSRRPEPVTQPSHSPAVPDFFALKANYLNMLNQNSESNPAPSNTDMSSATVSPADLQQPLAGDFNGDFEGLLRSLGISSPSSPVSPESYSFPSVQGSAGQPDMSPFEPNEFLTSPWTPSLDTFGESPGETPLSEFLNTPLIADNDSAMFTGPLFDESPLFDTPADTFESSKPPALDTSGLLTLSPTSPALDPATLMSPPMLMNNNFPMHSQPHASPSNDVSSPNVDAARHRASATGTRKNITTDSLVPLEAPTQPRRYLTPSATSKKELPAVFARKRAHKTMLDEPLKPNATELEQIEWKRRQNTLAARKSRKRKLMHQQQLETEVSALSQDREKWRQRALTLQGILQANGIPFGDFQD